MKNLLKIFSGNSNLNLAQDICKIINLSLGDAEVSNFPDGETFVKINENIRGNDVFIIQSMHHPANHHFMELLIMIDAIKRASASRITAVIPFFGYARQDRKDQPRVPITAKLVANLLGAAGANRILTVDLHAQQLQGFFDIPVDHLYASSIFYNYLLKIKSKSNLSVFAPDVGGIKMAAAYADLIDCPLGFVTKKRISASTVNSSNVIGEVKNRDILIVDDMMETAGTLTSAAKLLKKNGANMIIAAITHGVLNKIGYNRLANPNCCIDQLITTNTTPVISKNLPIAIMSVADLLGEAIIRIHNNQSVTSLFKMKNF